LGHFCKQIDVTLNIKYFWLVTQLGERHVRKKVNIQGI
jgi:hypothetical protein